MHKTSTNNNKKITDSCNTEPIRNLTAVAARLFRSFQDYSRDKNKYIDPSWKRVSRPGQDICIHKFKNQTSDVVCILGGYALVIDNNVVSDQCRKNKTTTIPSKSTKISCDLPEHKHKKKGRDVCLKANF